VQPGACIAELHEKSVSPAGKFGFPVPTYDGDQLQVTAWDSSWPSFFGKLVKGVVDLEIQTDGHWKELENVVHRNVSHVVPKIAWSFGCRWKQDQAKLDTR